MDNTILSAEWPAPANVGTLITTRQGGASCGDYASNNLALHVGDDPEAVGANRQRLLNLADGVHAIQWLQQVHGTAVVDASGEAVLEADGCYTTTPALGCAVLTADCLPVLICDRGGRQVAAVHAGWRGLAQGILLPAIRCFKVPPSELLVYLGPAISQMHFEVGAEVYRQFVSAPTATSLGSDYTAVVSRCFQPSSEGRYRADLYGIARAQCRAVGLCDVFGGDHCTFRDSDAFYSYRRDGTTGRMASLVWLKG